MSGLTVPEKTGGDRPVVIIQRVIPHYRRALFQRLHDAFGWLVVADGAPSAFGLNVGEQNASWLRPYPFARHPHREYAVRIPIRQIVADLDPSAIIAEFSLQSSACWTLALDALRGRGPRLAFWSQGWNVERGFRRPADLMSQIARLGLLAPADAQLCYSEAGASYLKRWMPTRQYIGVAANTVDIHAFPGREIDRAPRNPRRARLLCIGRVTADKNMTLVVEAVRRVIPDFPDIHLTIVGDGPVHADVVRAAAGIEAHVTFTGPVYDDDALMAIFQETTLMLIGGSAGLNVNHALAYGVPVMLFDNDTDVGHHPEHVYVRDGVTGYRVNGGGVDAFAARLRQALSQPRSPKQIMADGIRRICEEELTLEHMVNGFHELERFLQSLPPRN